MWKCCCRKIVNFRTMASARQLLELDVLQRTITEEAESLIKVRLRFFGVEQAGIFNCRSGTRLSRLLRRPLARSWKIRLSAGQRSRGTKRPCWVTETTGSSSRRSTTICPVPPQRRRRYGFKFFKYIFALFLNKLVEKFRNVSFSDV